ncbi:IS66-like element accessory protein TnpA [Rhizobium leguminosarum]|uniref:IS66-like element accessory protein TnpA n=2 Tax=Rhizobium TaxID=379 RepID=UPI001AE7D3F5|nr:transposase [Rhizobium leguminosarum]MBP2449117.1 transposase [Rhizobium leguminosarum]
MDEDAPKLQVRLVGRDGRRRYDPASRDQLVAACLEPGVSVSRLALEHGVNANLVRKWMKKAREERPLPVVSPFVPVQIAPDMHSAAAGNLLMKTEPLGKRSHASNKVSALLPNGVSLTVECDDLDGLTAIIGALGHVQTGR